MNLFNFALHGGAQVVALDIDDRSVQTLVLGLESWASRAPAGNLTFHTDVDGFRSQTLTDNLATIVDAAGESHLLSTADVRDLVHKFWLAYFDKPVAFTSTK